MKRSSFFLALTLLVTSFSVAQDYFTVQVGSFLDVRPQDFDPIRPLGLVYANQIDNNLYNVFIGGYTSQDKAEEMVDRLRNYNFTSARAVAIDRKAGETVTIIQLATRYVGKEIEWEAFQQMGNIFVILEDERIKVVTGIFADIESAKPILTEIRRESRYDDAFIKQVNSAQLVAVTPFTTGLKQPLIPLDFTDNTPPPSKPVEPQTRAVIPEQERPVAMDQPQEGVMTPRTPSVPRPTTTTKGEPEEVPASFEEMPSTRITTTATPRITPVTPEKTTALPAIRGKIKRRSALELQKVLKAEGYYDSGLDGYYGPGTTGAYEDMMANDATINKYELLAATLPGSTTAGNRLQQAINGLYTDPDAALTIESSTEPIARAYQAYQLFVTLGPGNEVNSLMNRAIRAAYEGKQLTQRPPFDYRATYAYQDINQLIQHLYYIHAAPGVDYAVPCWLNNRHPEAATLARTAVAGFTNHLELQPCDPFLEWDEIRLVQTIAFEITPSARDKQAQLNVAASNRSRLYLAETPLSSSEQTSVDAWNQRIWDNLNPWAASDPLHGDLVKALKVTYFQSQVRLEDFYMDQGFKLTDAQGLALATLQTLVGVPLERFNR